MLQLLVPRHGVRRVALGSKRALSGQPFYRVDAKWLLQHYLPKADISLGGGPEVPKLLGRFAW